MCFQHFCQNQVIAVYQYHDVVTTVVASTLWTQLWWYVLQCCYCSAFVIHSWKIEKCLFHSLWKIELIMFWDCTESQTIIVHFPGAEEIFNLLISSLILFFTMELMLDTTLFLRNRNWIGQGLRRKPNIIILMKEHGRKIAPNDILLLCQ